MQSVAVWCSTLHYVAVVLQCVAESSTVSLVHGNVTITQKNKTERKKLRNSSVLLIFVGYEVSFAKGHHFCGTLL